MRDMLAKLQTRLQTKVNAISPQPGKPPPDVQKYVMMQAAINGLRFLIQMIDEGTITQEDLNV